MMDSVDEDAESAIIAYFLHFDADQDPNSDDDCDEAVGGEACRHPQPAGEACDHPEIGGAA